MRARADDATWPAFGSILAPFWEPKWAPELIGNDIWRRRFEKLVFGAQNRAWGIPPGCDRVRPDPPERGRGEVNLSQGKEYQGKEY